MSKQKLTFSDFVNRAAVEPAFLQTYLRDPDRLGERFDLEAGLLDKIKSRHELLGAVSSSNPQELSGIARSLYSSPVAGFSDGFGDGGFKDYFKDHGDHKDRFKDNNG